MLNDQTFNRKYWLILNDAFFVKNFNEAPNGLNIEERLVYFLAFSDQWRIFYNLLLLKDVYSTDDYMDLSLVLDRMSLQHTPIENIPNESQGLGIVSYAGGWGKNDFTGRTTKSEFVLNFTSSATESIVGDEFIRKANQLWTKN